MIQLETHYAGLTLSSPILVASSGLTNQPTRNFEFQKAGAGAIVLKSLFEEEIELRSDRMMQTTDLPEAADYIRNYVKYNQLDHYIELIQETRATCSIPIIASINCYKSDAWIDFACQIEAAGADALELNVHYLFTELNFSYDEAVRLYVSILKQVKQKVTIPVIMKIGKYFSNIPALVNLLKYAGAQGVVLFNRYYQTDINIRTLELTSGEVFSQASDLSDTLRWTAIVSGKVPGISISSSTGVHTWSDAVKCILAGATTVQVCSAVYQHGSPVITEMITQITQWMKQMSFPNLAEFRGKLSFSNVSDPAFYERHQFMKYFSNRE